MMDERVRKEALNQLKNRYSCRQFLDKRIPNQVMDEILEVGLNAASGGNLQPVSIVMISQPGQKKKLRRLCGQGFIEQAGVILVFLLDYYRLRRWAEVEKAPFGKQNGFIDFIISMEDVVCVAQSIETAANLSGLGSVYIGTINAFYDKIRELIDLPELTIPVLMLCLGYPDDPGSGAKKLPRRIVVHEETYSRISDEEVTRDIVDGKYDNWMQPLEGKTMEQLKKDFCEIAKAVNSEEYAREVVASIAKQEGLNTAQYRLGHHYNPVRMAGLNKQMFEFYRKQGFNFLSLE